jgi:hypothetical protein
VGAVQRHFHPRAIGRDGNDEIVGFLQVFWI